MTLRVDHRHVHFVKQLTMPGLDVVAQGTELLLGRGEDQVH